MIVSYFWYGNHKKISCFIIDIDLMFMAYEIVIFELKVPKCYGFLFFVLSNCDAMFLCFMADFGCLLLFSDGCNDGFLFIVIMENFYHGLFIFWYGYHEISYGLMVISIMEGWFLVRLSWKISITTDYYLYDNHENFYVLMIISIMECLFFLW